MLRLLFVFVFIMIFNISVSADSLDTDKIENMIDNGELVEVISILDKYTVSNVSDSEKIRAYLYLSSAYRYDNKFNEAKNALRKSADLAKKNNTYSEVRYSTNLANIESSEMHYLKITDFNKAKSLVSNESSLIKLSLLLFYGEDKNAALKYLNDMLNAYSFNELADFSKGTLCFIISYLPELDPELCNKLADEFIKTFPDSDDDYVMDVLTYKIKAIDNPDKKLAEIEKMLSSLSENDNPKYFVILNQSKIQTLIDKKDFDEARTTLEKLKDYCKNNGDANEYLTSDYIDSMGSMIDLEERVSKNDDASSDSDTNSKKKS